ncbi:MAG TPA: hypothetical protein VK722_09100 [Candidatus Aquilonibacter sp.]|nr:hypothetical protein [Candidatus Aquilonibacter sp.]
MKERRRSAAVSVFLLSFAFGFPSAFHSYASAQSQGQNDVWSASAQTGSSAFLDASMFGAAGADICTRIYDALQSAASASLPGIVIDARGINTQNSANDGLRKKLRHAAQRWDSFACRLGRSTAQLTPTHLISIQNLIMRELPDQLN